MPGLSISSDSGYGALVVVGLYRYDGVHKPYKWALRAQVFATTEGLQRHYVRYDMPRFMGYPLRFTARAELYNLASGHYCGLGGNVSCDEEQARTAATAKGLTGDAFDTFVRRYYRMRVLEPIGRLLWRLQLVGEPWRTELMFGWRGRYTLPGTFTEDGPFVGSRYDLDNPGGQRGLVSMLRVGVMLDRRDHEFWPTRGIWAETSGRWATAMIGSDWDYVAANAKFAVYVPVTDSRRLVWASRVIFDAMRGDGPTRELETFGGFDRQTGFGGSYFGRGIRGIRYRGKVKGGFQTELRAKIAESRFGKMHIGWGAAAFADVGFGTMTMDVTTDDIHASYGLGLRAAMNENFIVRIDVGVSAVESWKPRIVTQIGHPF